MAATSTQMLPLGTPAPDFAIPNALDGQTVRLSDVKDARAVLIFFACNHCPYVVHVKDEIARLHAEYESMGIRFFAINSNDVDEYPEDSPENMKNCAEEWGWRFPYLFDETQQVAISYGASCTPDFFLFDSEMKLSYRGQLDGSRPGNGIPVTGADLRRAIQSVLNGELPGADQKPSMGCSIKWKAGNMPSYSS